MRLKYESCVLMPFAVFALGNIASAASFVTPGSWSYTVPSGVTSVSVTLSGAGGGGGGADSNGAGGAGGNGGSINVVFNVTAGQIVSGVVGGGGGTGFTGGSGFNASCKGGGAAPGFGGGGAGANANCSPSSGYSGGGGGGGGACSVSYGGIVVAQAGGGGGGSGGGWNNPGIAGVSVSNRVSASSACATLGTGTAGVALGLDGGAGSGGGGGVPGGVAGLGSIDNPNSSASIVGNATAGGKATGGGAGGNCYNSAANVWLASANGSGGAGAAGQTTTTSTAGTPGTNGSVIIVPYVANMGITKVASTLSDPVHGTTNPKAIPGAVIQYCLMVTNNGPAIANNVTVSDTLPAKVTFVANSLYKGASCTASLTQQSNPSPATAISVNVGSLANGGSAGVVFQVTVN